MDLLWKLYRQTIETYARAEGRAKQHRHDYEQARKLKKKERQKFLKDRQDYLLKEGVRNPLNFEFNPTCDVHRELGFRAEGNAENAWIIAQDILKVIIAESEKKYVS